MTVQHRENRHDADVQNMREKQDRITWAFVLDPFLNASSPSTEEALLPMRYDQVRMSWCINSAMLFLQKQFYIPAPILNRLPSRALKWASCCLWGTSWSSQNLPHSANSVLYWALNLLLTKDSSGPSTTKNQKNWNSILPFRLYFAMQSWFIKKITHAKKGKVL